MSLKPNLHKKAVLFCLPGGGASREFFDLAPDYSFAARMNKAGHDVILMDHPNTASNILSDPQLFFRPGNPQVG